MDPKRYPNPTSFEPSRFLAHSLSASAYANSPNVLARDHWSYGSSKRICVGMHLAERSLFNMVSRLLQAFDIKHAVDENGKEIPVDVNAYKTSLIAGPEPFKARFVVRAEEIGALLDSEWQKLFGEGEKETWSQ
jgi:cytochrome P450